MLIFLFSPNAFEKHLGGLNLKIYIIYITIDEDLIAALPGNGGESEMLQTATDFAEDLHALSEEIRTESFRTNSLLEQVDQNNLLNDATSVHHTSLN